MPPKAGGNLEAIKHAAEAGAAALRDAGEHLKGAKPIASEAADKVVEQLKGEKGPFTMGVLKERMTRENGIMAGGAVVAADGVRRAIHRDEDGERHVVRGVIQAAVGVGAFAAALATQRSKIAGSSNER